MFGSWLMSSRVQTHALLGLEEVRIFRSQVTRRISRYAQTSTTVLITEQPLKAAVSVVISPVEISRLP